MDREQFGPQAPGRLVAVTDAPADARHAFVPDPLPPAWPWPVRLWPLLVEARTALAALDGVGRHLPNAAILLRPIQLREAQLSSQLEGTVTDPRQQALFQADPSYPGSDTDPANAFREVFNYGVAVGLRLRGSREQPLSLLAVRQLHQVLMDGVRGQDQRPGEFRTVQNRIGRPARFVPVPPAHLAEVLADFESYLGGRSDDGFDPLVRAFLAHYQFEAIHPFRDGNGRVGRLLLALTIADWCALSGQWLYLSAYFERHKQAYMDLLLAVSTEAAWEAWLEFCLRGVVEESRDTERRCERLLALHRDFHARVAASKGASVRLAALVDRLFEQPAVTVTWVRDHFAVTHPTARADLARLELLGVLQRLEGQSQITYYCRRLYEVTYDDA